VLDPYGKRASTTCSASTPGAFGAFVLMGYEFDRGRAVRAARLQAAAPGQQRGVPELNPA
jgi:hypothetical protein